jgi:hypothetical protein
MLTSDNSDLTIVISMSYWINVSDYSVGNGWDVQTGVFEWLRRGRKKRGSILLEQGDHMRRKLRGSLYFRASRLACAVAGFSVSAGWLATPSAKGQSLILDDVYHAQTTSYTCAIASMEMQLDIPQVTDFNPFAATLLAQGDGNYVPLGAAPQNGAQSYIYYMVHSAGAAALPAYNVNFNNANGQPNLNANAFTYNNPAIRPVPGSGSDLNSLQFGTNVLDNPNVAGIGTDGYASYNLASGYYASRTIAAAMKDTGIPAVIAINPNPFGFQNGQLGGQHAISVFGVNTTASPTLNGAYTINGFFVHDPWTGYANNVAGVAALAGRGIGVNTYLRYGYNKPVPGAPALTLPDGTQATVSPYSWFSYFVPSGGQYAPTVNQLYQTGVGYKFEVEPQGPELPDTGGPNGSFNSLPAPTPLLSTDLSSSGADSDAQPDLVADGLNTEPGFENGSWDTADTIMLADPNDPTAQGDWLIPYDGSGGVNDVTGAELIDMTTGVIDQATWFDPTDPITSMTLSQIDELYTDQLNDIVENDNSVPLPEPASLLLIVPAAALLMGRRPRRANA